MTMAWTHNVLIPFLSPSQSSPFPYSNSFTLLLIPRSNSHSLLSQFPLARSPFPFLSFQIQEEFGSSEYKDSHFLSFSNSSFSLSLSLSWISHSVESDKEGGKEFRILILTVIKIIFKPDPRSFLFIIIHDLPFHSFLKHLIAFSLHNSNHETFFGNSYMTSGYVRMNSNHKKI